MKHSVELGLRTFKKKQTGFLAYWNLGFWNFIGNRAK